MKKSFLVLGVLGSLCVANSYADIVISQDSPDMTISVSRATRGDTKVKENGKTLPEGARLKMAVADGNPTGQGSGALVMNCPAACTPNCGVMGNILVCNGCQYSDGTYCSPIDAVASADLEVKQPEKK